MDKPNTGNGFNSSYFYGNRYSSDSDEVLFRIKNGKLNTLSVFVFFFSSSPLIFFIYIYVYIYIYK